MSDLDLRKFPLPDGHYFGQAGHDLRASDGSEDPRLQHALAEWQRTFAKRFGDRDMIPTGVYGGPTQRAAHQVQRDAGLPLTGNVDMATWISCLSLGREPVDVAPAAADEIAALDRARAREAKRAANKARHAKTTNQREHELKLWKGKSDSVYTYGRAGCPPWWPGEDFGLNAEGEHVKKVAQILGLSQPRRFGPSLEQRVRGLQVANDLPATGVVDLTTAKLLDEI